MKAPAARKQKSRKHLLAGCPTEGFREWWRDLDLPRSEKRSTAVFAAALLAWVAGTLRERTGRDSGTLGLSDSGTKNQEEDGKGGRA